MFGLKRRFHKAWLFLWILIVVVILLAFHKYEWLRDRDEKLGNEIESVKIENSVLADKVNRLKTDPAYAEKVARQKLGLAEKGEVIYKILPEGERR